jgi:hypothetical protein
VGKRAPPAPHVRKFNDWVSPIPEIHHDDAQAQLLFHFNAREAVL